MEYTLNQVEQELSRIVAKLRYETNRKDGVRDCSIGKVNPDLEGIGAELAFCRIHNVYPDLTIFSRTSSDDGFDAVFSGMTVDVKATQYRTGRLLVAPWKADGRTPDYYALMTGTFPSYIFRGVISGTEMLRPERLGDMGHGPTYVAEQSELLPQLP